MQINTWSRIFVKSSSQSTSLACLSWLSTPFELLDIVISLHNTSIISYNFILQRIVSLITSRSRQTTSRSRPCYSIEPVYKFVIQQAILHTWHVNRVTSIPLFQGHHSPVDEIDDFHGKAQHQRSVSSSSLGATFPPIQLSCIALPRLLNRSPTVVKINNHVNFIPVQGYPDGNKIPPHLYRG